MTLQLLRGKPLAHHLELVVLLQQLLLTQFIHLQQQELSLLLLVVLWIS
jgi:hypothetical protein